MLVEHGAQVEWVIVGRGPVHEHPRVPLLTHRKSKVKGNYVTFSGMMIR